MLCQTTFFLCQDMIGVKICEVGSERARETAVTVSSPKQQMERSVQGDEGEDGRRWKKVMRRSDENIMHGNIKMVMKLAVSFSGKGGAAEEMGRGRRANTACKHACKLKQICRDTKKKTGKQLNWLHNYKILSVRNTNYHILLVSACFPAACIYAFCLPLPLCSSATEIRFLSENYCLNTITTTGRTDSNVESDWYFEWL